VAGIGRDLLDLPFAELVRNLAVAIADGQTALDQNSLQTMQLLVDTHVDLVNELTEIIESDMRTVVAGGQSVEVSGVRITPSSAPPVRMSMFQAGLLPTFYQFTEASIDVRLSITMREDTDAQSAGRSAAAGGVGVAWLGFGATRAYASSVDYRTQNKYSYTAQGASILRATLKPVPPPPRLEPTVTTINMLAQPPVVTRTPG